MKTTLNLLIIGLMLVFFNGCKESQPEFKGKIAKLYEESVESWPEKKRPPKDAPNVIIFLLEKIYLCDGELCNRKPDSLRTISVINLNALFIRIKRI